MSTGTSLLSDCDDPELVRQILAGSREAFALLVRRHQAAVRWRLARYITDAATVDDLAQEVFLNAFEHLASLRAEGSLRAWLLGVARNRARQHLRGEFRRQARETGPLALALAEWRLERLERAEDEGLDQELVFGQLRDCIDALPPASRQLVDAHYFRQQTVEDLARSRGCKAGSLRMTLLRVRQALGKCLRQKLGNSL